MDNPNASKEDCDMHDESGIEYDNCYKDLEYPQQREVCAAPNVPGLIRPTSWSKPKPENRCLMVSAIATRRNKGNKKQYHRMGHFVFNRCFMLHGQECHLG